MKRVPPLALGLLLCGLSAEITDAATGESPASPAPLSAVVVTFAGCPAALPRGAPDAKALSEMTVSDVTQWIEASPSLADAAPTLAEHKMDGLALSLASAEQLITQVVGLPLGTALKLKYCADEMLSHNEPALDAPERQGVQPPEPPPTLAHENTHAAQPASHPPHLPHPP